MRFVLKPEYLFLYAFLFYNLSGIINFGQFNNELDLTISFIFFTLPICAILLGYFSANLIPLNINRHRVGDVIYIFKNLNLYELLFFFFSISLIVINLIYIGGVPAIDNELRLLRTGLPGVPMITAIYKYFFFLHYIVIRLYKHKCMKFLYYRLFLYCSFTILLGYRAPLIEIFLMISLFELYMIKSFRLKTIILLSSSFLFILSAASMYAYFRALTEFNDPQLFYRQIDFNFFEENVIFMPFLAFFALMRHTQTVIQEIFFSLDGFYFGKLAIANIMSVLTDDLSARRVVGGIIGARIIDGAPVSITPTLQGALYIDFGFLGVIFGFFVAALLIKYIGKVSEKTNNPLHILLFCFLLARAIMSVHNGYLDFFIVFAICVLVFFRLIQRKVRLY